MDSRNTSAYQISASDNVATLFFDGAQGTTVPITGETGPAGEEVARGGAVTAGAAINANYVNGERPRITLCEAIGEGHKVAIRDIARGDDVIKFGVPIGYARVAISAGEWVHLHNCASHYDDRSSTLDLETGAATDTVYE